MKRKVIILIFFIIICIIVGSVIYKNYKAQKRYAEIRENVKRGVEWNIRAMYPKCSLVKESNEQEYSKSTYHSDFLINNGYIKKNELLDIDNSSYCDVFVENYAYFENPMDYQNNCEVYYKIYLKCKNYEEEGYLVR